MTSLLADWWLRLVASPPLMGCVAVAIVAWAAALRVLWPRLPGLAWRTAWGLSALGFLLAMIVFIAPPAERRTAAIPVLVTKGTSADALAAVADASDAFVTGGAWREPAVAEWIGRRVRTAARGLTVRIAAVDDVALYGPAPARLRVIGDGLDAVSWADAHWRGEVAFTPPRDRAGIAEVRWPRSVEAGLPVVIEARATAATPSDARYVLRDAGGATLATLAENAGSIAGPALPVGRHVLSLSLEADDATYERRDVPVIVRDPAPARVLVLQAAPSFEWRALGRWLARAGAALATRTRISETRFRERFTGIEARALAPLAPTLLSDFDLVIADGAALAVLDESERDLLLNGDHGAGVLVLLHDPADVAALPGSLRALLDGDVGSESVYQLQGAVDRLDTGLGRLALDFDERVGEALVRDIAGAPVAARIAPGSRVALSLVRDSYRLAAVGAGDAHARLWSSIVRQLARRAPPAGARFSPRDTRAGERVRVCMPARVAPESVTLRDGAGNAFDVGLAATSWRPAERCGWAWPDAPGWLTAVRPADEAAEPLGAHWVVADGPSSTSRRLERIAATTARAEATQRSAAELPIGPATLPRSRFLVALLAFGLLTALSERLAAARHHARSGPS